MLEKWIASSIDDLNVSTIMEYATYKGYSKGRRSKSY